MTTDVEKPPSKKELAYKADVYALAEFILKDVPEEDRRVIEDMTSHFFAPGVYCRMYWLPTGDIVLGREHKTTHLNILTRGKVRVATPEGPIVFDARAEPLIFVSGAGVQKTIFCEDECFWITVHPNPTDETDIEKLEEQIAYGAPELDSDEDLT